jgi:hypothetical protein
MIVSKGAAEAARNAALAMQDAIRGAARIQRQ